LTAQGKNFKHFIVGYCVSWHANKFECDCPDFTMRVQTGKKKECKHIKEIREKLGVEQ
jgi:predicted nucleic acid-binding Zn finger protein